MTKNSYKYFKGILKNNPPKTKRETIFQLDLPDRTAYVNGWIVLKPERKKNA